MLIRTILSPYVDPSEAGADPRVRIDGPEVAISGDAVTNLAMILHELATNAAKYGAFSVQAGQVHISWAAPGGRLALSWEERGGPLLNGGPASEGFGSQLARRSVNALDGELNLDWRPAGLIARISAAKERLTL